MAEEYEDMEWGDGGGGPPPGGTGNRPPGIMVPPLIMGPIPPPSLWGFGVRDLSSPDAVGSKDTR